MEHWHWMGEGGRQGSFFRILSLGIRYGAVDLLTYKNVTPWALFLNKASNAAAVASRGKPHGQVLACRTSPHLEKHGASIEE